MPGKPTADWFRRHLRTVLNALYDPGVVRSSPLIGLLGLEQHANAVSALQRALIDSIENLRPLARAPDDSRTWRLYQILRRRYTEQVPQRKVAADLGLSIRQLQREEKVAREVLADYLWSKYGVEARDAQAAPASTAPVEAGPPTRAEELASLRESVPLQVADVGEVIRGVAQTVRPLLNASGITLEQQMPAGMPRMPLPVPILRQALLNIITTVARWALGGRVLIRGQVLPQGACITVRCLASPAAAPSGRPQGEEGLEMARQLLHLCRGSLEVAWAGNGADSSVVEEGAAEVLRLTITLPGEEQPAVLVIDDNADVLQLFQRYVTGTRYRLVGTQDVQRGLEMAAESPPQIIVIDIMMPDRDGWALLGQLREHPNTAGIPIIVCTILPQEDLAYTLGAAGFIRKPVRREAFLTALDRQMAARLKGT